MKKVIFESIKIINFKGMESFETDFSHDTIIRGANKKGKSTISDAIHWVLFGKDSNNRENFSIKNTVNTDLNRADHIVELTMNIDGLKTVAKRIYRERWSKKRGDEVTTFDSNETEYFWNNVPKKMKEFQVLVSEICEESIFRMLTNPKYFNEVLKENERREKVIGMAGDITNEKVINGTAVYQELFAKLQGQKSLEDYRKEISYEKSGLKKYLDQIPVRIDELIHSNPDTLDWKDLENEIAQKEQAIIEIDQDIEGTVGQDDKFNKTIQAHFDARLNAQLRMNEIRLAFANKENNAVSTANMEIISAKGELNLILRNIESLIQNRDNATIQLEQFEKKLERLRGEYDIESKKQFTFDRETCKCTQCNRKFETTDIELMEKSHRTYFHIAKIDSLDKLNNEGQQCKKDIANVTKMINQYTDQIDSLTTKKEEVLEISMRELTKPKDIETLLLVDADYMANLEIFEKAVPEKKVTDVADLRDMKKVLQEGIDALKKQLSNKEVIGRNLIRIDELKEDEKRMSKDLANLEKIEFTIESFQKRRMEMIESAVNQHFSFVKFRLFETLVTTGNEVSVFKTIVDGVPYSDANRAGQTNAGIDIINAFSKVYGISVPIILDNAESVNEFLPTESQTIKMYVTRDEELVIA